MAPYSEKIVKDMEVLVRLQELGFPMAHTSYYRKLNAAINTLSGILWGYTARDTLPLMGIIQKLDKDMDR